MKEDGDSSIEARVLLRLHDVLGHAKKPVALHEPEFVGNERSLVLDCLDSIFVSTVGAYVTQFEDMLAKYTGAKHAIAVVNGTAALHISLIVAGVGPEDEVLLPSLSFVATANAVVYCGGIPHFVDSSLRTMGLDPLSLGDYLRRVGETTNGGFRNRITGRRIAAVVPMHAYGHPIALEDLLKVSQEYGIPVIEDAAESLGSSYHGQHTGTFGTLGTFSFNGNKIITTGGGGAILTNDSTLARRAKHLTTTARSPHRWTISHDEVAWNYRLPNLNAALGCAQMEMLPKFLIQKRRLAEQYSESFSNLDGVCFMCEPENTKSNYWLNTIKMDGGVEARDRLLEAASEAGFQCRPTWTLLHKLPMFTDCPRAPLPVAENLESSLVNLPSSPRLARFA